MEAETLLGQKFDVELYGATDPEYAQTAFLRCIGEYIEENVVFRCLFNGKDSKGKDVSLNVDIKVQSRGLKNDRVVFEYTEEDYLEDNGLAMWEKWMSQVYEKISMHCGLVDSGSGTFFSGDPLCWQMTKPSWSRDSMTEACLENPENPRGKCLDALASGIISDMRKDFIPTNTGVLTDGGNEYTGTLTVLEVIAPEK